MRVMLDTNVIISILVFDSKKLKKMLEEITDKYKLVLSTYVLDELAEVIRRKFKNKIGDMNEFLYNLPFEVYYTPQTIISEKSVEIRDIKDYPVLYSSIMSDVDVLITGDKDFDDIDIEKPEILTPSEFMEKY
jgi:putative PIN family toxin of toxin-antitoxin system